MKHLQISQLDCCGVHELSGFFEDSDEFNDCIPVEEARKDLRSFDKELAAMAIVILNDYQFEIFNSMLLEEGYKHVAEEKNPNSNNIVYMFVKCRKDLTKYKKIVNEHSKTKTSGNKTKRTLSGKTSS